MDQNVEIVYKNRFKVVEIRFQKSNSEQAYSAHRTRNELRTANANIRNHL